MSNIPIKAVKLAEIMTETPDRFSPFPALHTKRLVLRQHCSADIDMIFFQRSDPRVNQFIDRELARTKKDAEDFLHRITKEVTSGNSISWALRLQERSEMIGSICLWNFSADRKTAEIGYDLHPSHQGQGLMSEATRAVLEFGFRKLELDLIDAFTHQKNKPSIKMLEDAGFVLQKDRSDPDNSKNRIYTISSAHYFSRPGNGH